MRILWYGVIAVIILSAVDMFYTSSWSADQKEVDEIEEGVLGLGFLGAINDFIKSLTSTLDFQSELLKSIEPWNYVVGLIIWATLIIGLIDILWIG